MALATMYGAVVNSPEMLLSAGIDSSQTTITVTDASAYVGVTLPKPMTIGTEADAETVLVTNRVSATLTVVRGWQGTAKAWGAGAIIARNFTASDHDTFLYNINDLDTRLGGKAAATHASQHATAGADPITPADIGAAATSHTHTLSALGAAAASHASAHATGGADAITPADIGASVSGHVHSLSSLGAEAAHIKATELSVLTSAWGADSTYTTLGYTQKASVAVTGMTVDMTPRVTFGSAAILLGTLAPFCAAYSGGVYIWAKSAPSATITIDSIEGVPA